jgi:ribosomal protein S18 acetylase RimI-like enzyme
VKNQAPPDWQLRPVEAADRDLLFDMHRQTMFEYVDAVWGWDEEVHNRFFDERFVLDGRRQVIQVGEHDVGMVEIWDEPSRLVLASIRVLPEWQCRGLGKAIIRSVLARGSSTGQPVVLSVLKVNVRARRLYEREGFLVVGETPTNVHMQAEPPTPR